MSPKRYLLGIDIGTSGVKAAVFDVAGRLISLARQEYRFHHPNPGWSEIDPEEVWAKTLAAVRECVSQSGLEARRITALGLSVLGETSLPLDERCRPVYPAIESIDKRDNAYKSYVAWFEERFGAEAIFKRTSYPLSAISPAIKLLWLREHRPEAFKRMHKYVTFQDFAVWRLTGMPASDYSMASRSMLFDVRQKVWIDEYLEAMGIPRHLFSPAYEAAHPVGELGEAVAKELGLAPGITVVPGAHDHPCEGLGVGLIREGTAVDGTGSVEAIFTVLREPITSLEMLRRGQGSQCHVSADLYLAMGFHLTAGNLVRWYRDQLGRWEKEEARRAGKDPYDLIAEAARTSPPGARGLLVLPHWSGAGTGRAPALNPDSRGVILGLSLGHTKADLNRALFEGITYEARFIIEFLESSGITIDGLVVTGGGAKSPFWLQLKADITGKRVMVPRVTEASLLGAAVLAGVGAGIYRDLEDAVERVFKVKDTFEPDPSVKATYDRMFAVYRDIYEAAIGISEKLAGFAESPQGAGGEGGGRRN